MTAQFEKHFRVYARFTKNKPITLSVDKKEPNSNATHRIENQ